ncbi:MAG TPA: spherulation-specific family 4 protein, partial [Pilimelia sp.]|nr:spherulation-specific family 4 protein [Pilimelia sp.]
MHTLLPLHPYPVVGEAVWRAVAGCGTDLTVVVSLAGGPEGGPGGCPQPPSGSVSAGHPAAPALGPAPAARYAAALGRLAAAGVPMLGRIDLARGDRPLAEVLADVARWSAYPIGGVLFDRAPTDAASLGAVALAIRVARRGGLAAAVLNPGRPPDPRYRELEAALCVFEGSWSAYRSWSAAGAEPGDGHLVYGVPPAEQLAARRLLGRRGAGFGLVTDGVPPHPY